MDLVRALPAPYMLLGLAALAAAAGGVGYVKGIQAEADRHAEYVRQVTDANAKLEAENARIKRESIRINQETVAGWSAAVDYLRRHPAVRVRGPDCGGESLRALPGGAGESGPGAGERGPGPGLEAAAEIPLEQCETRLNRAVEDAAQVMWLLDWAARQREASTP